MSIHRATYEDILWRCDLLARQDQRLRPDQAPLAALDADGTLWGPDVAELLWERLLRERALNRRSAAPIARALRECGGEPSRDPYLDYAQILSLRRAGRTAQERLVRVMLAGLAGLRERDVHMHAEAAIAEASDLGGLREGPTGRLVEQLRALGFRVIVVSGSPRWAVEAAVRPLGIARHDVLAGQVSVVDGVLTDGIVEPLPWGQGKVQAILRRFGAVPRLSMGNGLGDLAMLEATSELRILVNPTDEMVMACEDLTGATWSIDELPAARVPRRVAPPLGTVPPGIQGIPSTPSGRRRRPTRPI